MKRFLAVVLCAVVVCSAAIAQEKKNKEVVTFLVEGMTCNNCVKKVEGNIAFEKGVTDLKCDLSTHTVEVTYRADKTTTDKLVQAFKKIGYEVATVEAGSKNLPSQGKQKDGNRQSSGK